MAKDLPKKTEDLSAWYNALVEKAELAEHGPSKGTMIIRPYGYALWEVIQKYMDPKIKDLGGKNAYFPLFIPMSFLQKEKEHVKGFAPELAVVTHGGGEKLAEPLVVRPTSETVMYNSFSRWIQSFRDLPLVVNQWNNVVRWEKRPYLFIRTTEFLWQEGHGANATHQESQKLVKDALNMYVTTYQDELALFGYAGSKSQSEKFAGADTTLTYEILMSDGKVVQGCTSHDLGQNFSKVFNVKFQDENGKEQFVYQNSWGFTTRSLGALIMVHGDDNGLVLPPRIAPIQVVVVPIVGKRVDSNKLKELSQKTVEVLEAANIRVQLDDSDQTAGWKFNQYDLLGVPLRIEIGENEVIDQKVSVKLRDGSEGGYVSLEELKKTVEEKMALMQHHLLDKSRKFTLENTREVESYEEFKKIMQTSKGFIKAFWCEEESCEAKIKDETKATTRCLPLDGKDESGSCIYCGKTAPHRWLFAQSY